VPVIAGVTEGNTVGVIVGEALGPTLAQPHMSKPAIKQMAITKIIVFFKIFASFEIIFNNKEANYNLIFRDIY